MKDHFEAKNLLAIFILSVFFVGGCKYVSPSSSNSNKAAAGNSKVDNSPASNKSDSKTRNREVLFDFRTEEGFPKQQKIEGAEADAVLKYVFGANYRTGSKSTSVDQRIYGAFSKPNDKETLYFVRGGTVEDERTLARGDISLLGYIVVFDKTEPVLSLKVSAYGIHKITDLNLDGKNELLLANGGYGQGISEDGLELAQIVNGGIQIIRDFGILHEDACAEGIPNRTGVSAGVIHYEALTEAGNFPQFELSYHKRSCDKNAVWEKLAKNPFSEE